MTYSLHTLNNSKETPPAVSGWQRFVQEIALSLGVVFLMFWLVAMLSHSAQDPAWTTSGSSAVPHNWGGRIGAAISDLGFFVAGYSIFWCFLASFISWLQALATRLRSEDSVAAHAHIWRLTRWAFWSGLVLLMVSSTGLLVLRSVPRSPCPTAIR